MLCYIYSITLAIFTLQYYNIGAMGYQNFDIDLGKASMHQTVLVIQNCNQTKEKSK